MAEKKIKEFALNDVITGFFIVRKADIREYTKGNYLTAELGDNSGRINAVYWEPDTFCLTELEAGYVVKVRGTVGEFRDKLQLTIVRIRLATEDEYSLDELLPHSKQTHDERKSRILNLTEKIENQYIKTLVESFWNDEKFFDKFLKAAAGKLWHHAYIGGLSEHSANLAELAVRVSVGYEYLNKDLLIFGGLFHDIGKLATYTTDMVIDFTDEGRLIDHICIADAWIVERAKLIENFPDKLLMKLRHIVLSHQGEYSTPVVPKIPEAFVIYYCDEIDSKMGALERIREKVGGKGWSDYINLIQRHVYFGEGDD